MSESKDYRLFGLQIRSEIELPELLSVRNTDKPDVKVRRGAIDAAEAAASLEFDGHGMLLTIPNVARFRIEGGSEILVDAAADVPARNLRLFLLGSAFGALLHQRGMLPLHANAIEIEGRAVAFMGESGSGKSTLAAWFHDRGYKVLTDDVCVVGFDNAAMPHAYPGLPRLRLWHDALQTLGRDASSYQRSYVGSDEEYEKFDVPIERCDLASEPVPLSAIYVLDRGDDLSIEQLTGLEAATAIFANTYRGSYVSVTGGHRPHWEQSLEIVRKIPVYRACRLWGLDGLDDQAGRMLAHAREPRSICVGCGLCCDGTLHGRTTVRSNDEARVAGAALEVMEEGGKRFFEQPCPNLECSKCRVYATRPDVCRTYQCGLLRGLDRGRIEEMQARDKIAIAQKLRASVRNIDAAAITPAQRSELTRRLQGRLSEVDAAEREEVARQLLDVAVLEHHLNRWFLNGEED